MIRKRSDHLTKNPVNPSPQARALQENQRKVLGLVDVSLRAFIVAQPQSWLVQLQEHREYSWRRSPRVALLPSRVEFYKWLIR